jgi:hypothetical protein
MMACCLTGVQGMSLDGVAIVEIGNSTCLLWQSGPALGPSSEMPRSGHLKLATCVRYLSDATVLGRLDSRGDGGRREGDHTMARAWWPWISVNLF